MNLRQRLLFPVLAVPIALWAAGPATAGAPALDPPGAEALDEARALVAAMRAGERGPYSRLRWYCNDGTVQPPAPYACAERGGGRQHGEYSPERRRLAELGWSVGTIVAALDWQELWDVDRRHQRLRELPLERYLTDTEDGWVLRRARYYRGRVQIEDEEQAGRKLLLRLLSDPAWVEGNFLLAREAVRTLPHHGGTDRTRTVRRLSQELAEQDSSFERIRIKIHTTPGFEDLRATRNWIAAARARGAAGSKLLATAESLAAEIDKLYGEDDWRATAAAALGRHPRWGELAPLIAATADGEAGNRLDRLGRAAARLREIVSASTDGAANLAFMDLSIALERAAVAAAFEVLGKEAMSRRDHLLLARRLLDSGYGAGLFSPGERDALAAPLDGLLASSGASSDELIAAVRRLRRAAPWALGSIRYAFAEPLVRYTALEPGAARFVDDLLRGSALLPFAEAVTRLAADADRLSGVAHRIFGETRGGMLGLNPGVARGRLRVVDAAELEAGAELGRDEIVVLPETVSELPPVAGILSLAEGNLLSHVQILARNLGIPNATLSPLLARRLAEHQGDEVLLAVGTDGSVVLESWSQVPAESRNVLEQGRAAAPAAKLTAPAPDLSVRRPLPLAELDASLSGRVVGPKAANLGELARQFPGRVAQAVALPFGVFADHVRAGADPPKQRLDRAFARLRAGEIGVAELAAEVETVRQTVAALELNPETRNRLGALMDELFAATGDHGVFVRSDTNVEDLPGFTGAGLNKTIPNLVDREKVFAAIPLVWSSPYTERAMAWRSGILARPEEVYASVLLMKSVPADKSGVLVTADLATRGRGLTVATAWGVGGAVDGEAAETLVLRPDGSTDLVGEAKAPYRRRLAVGGGVEWVPAEAGPVLTAAERDEVRRLAAEAVQKLEPAHSPAGEPLPWDIEFGFVDGRLTLFQVRPLVERGQQLADRVVAGLTAEARRRPPATVELDAPLEVDE